MREGRGGERGGGQKKTPEPRGGSGNFVVKHLQSIGPPLTLSGINYDRSLRISHRYSLPNERFRLQASSVARSSPTMGQKSLITLSPRGQGNVSCNPIWLSGWARCFAESSWWYSFKNERIVFTNLFLLLHFRQRLIYADLSLLPLNSRHFSRDIKSLI